tara:strand:- start:2618 stop:3445 length:828 start_codon:yes stop_codon:yes gene_type:complete
MHHDVMKSPLRWLARRREIGKLAERCSELELELSAFIGKNIKLQPAKTKGGYDEIYTVLQGGTCIAVLRVNSPYRAQKDPIGELDPYQALDGPDRLALEWTAYQRLNPIGLSPKPLWRTNDAIACSWFPWNRASEHLVNNRSDFWNTIEKIIPAIAQMHHHGVTHLDLNLGNVLLEPNCDGVALIDFEFGPKKWATLPQQQAFDFLKIIDDCTRRRRGGDLMLKNIHRLEYLLHTHVPLALREADMHFAHTSLKKLKDYTELCKALNTVFNGFSR